MNEEGYYKVLPILVNGDHKPLLDVIVDNPQIGESSLRYSAGVDTKIKTVMLHDKIFKWQFIDFSKQEQFKFLQSKFKPNAMLIVYDATDMVSFTEAIMLLEEHTMHSNGSVFMLLVGNDHNLDDNDDNKAVNTKTGEELARRFKIHFIEASAENPDKLEQALRFMTESKTKINKTGAIQMEG